MDRQKTSEQFEAGRSDAKFKSRRDAIQRAVIHGIILAVAIFYPAAVWKRVVGAILAFFLVGLIVQFRAVRRGSSKTSANQI